jgi:hypothetical protein
LTTCAAAAATPYHATRESVQIYNLNNLAMGTDLYAHGNHNIVFQNREYREIGEEIRLKLEALDLYNSPFLKHFQLWKAHVYEWKETQEEIMKKEDWVFFNEMDLKNFNENKTIEFHGPFDLSIDFKEQSIVFFDPSYRYWTWFEPDFNRIRNEWRKYIYRILTLFGGNRVVYLPDNTHILEEYNYYEGTFEEMEKALEEKVGKPQKSFSGVMADFDNAYLIDYFDDLNFDEVVDFNQFLPLDSPIPKKRISKYF